MAAITVNTNGQALTVNASISHWTTAALAVTASASNDVESTTTTTINSDYTMHFANTATTALITVKQLDGSTLLAQTFNVEAGTGQRTLNPMPDEYSQAADFSTMLRDHPRYLEAGETFSPRWPASHATATGPTTGQMALTYFTALKSESCVSMSMITGGVAAAATPTLCKMALYEVDASGNIALLAATANDTTLFAATNTKYTKAFATPANRVAGRRYAAGALVVSAGACPDFLVAALGAAATMSTEMVRLPIVSCKLTSLADVPASETVANQISTATRVLYYGSINPA